MAEEEYLDRETIEYYLCSNGQEKVRKKFNYHFVQQTAYDCGPACCWLIVKWGKRFMMNDNFSYMDFLESIDGNVEDGLWTIELLKILKVYDFRCVFCTTNVSPSKRQYDYLDFYRSSSLEEDLQRIQNLFQTISNDCIHIFNAQVAIETIADFIQFNPNTVVLLLVDYSVLYPSRSCCTFKDYCSHYIILIGYSRSRKSFKVVDPTRYFHHFIKEGTINAARLSAGTDNDIIFINLE